MFENLTRERRKRDEKNSEENSNVNRHYLLRA